MPTILHSTLAAAECHVPKVEGFTGDPASYTPAEAGLFVIATDTNFAYRTTGTNAGDVEQVGGGPVETFTGAASSFTPTTSGVLAVKTDVTPNILYLTTGVSAGDVDLVGAIVLVAASGSPVGSTTPDYIGQTFTQSESDRIVNWISTGLTNNDWLAIGGTAVQSLSDPAETPAFVGQEWQVVTTATMSPFVTLVRLWVGLDPTGNADTSSWYQLV